MDQQPIRHPNESSFNAIVLFRQVLQAEAEALIAGAQRAGQEVEQAVRILRQTTGKVIITGLGKAGYVARKGAATFCSTGTPAIYLHPSEALHGDIGVVTSRDTLVAISSSGETEEVLALLPHMARIGSPVIAITGKPNSALANRSTVVIDAAVAREADPIALAPTSSTTLAMAICDALAVTLMTERGFTREQFAIFHPGGSLGRKLLLKVVDLMRIGDSIPFVTINKDLNDAVAMMTAKKMGAVFVVDSSQKVVGVLTDGDLRRLYQKQQVTPQSSLALGVGEVMHVSPKQITADALAAEALKLMEDHRISVLPVVDAQSKLVGALHLHDLIRAGLA